ncbi:sugar-binding transcriptional regulator [Falsibacillus albus]|uniref:Sugar-binding transcriptional regulator n=1 Tax=Falsibacillus albus TaxID=2478915 RepID=A0A3L7K2V3_9BACI|nr:sugar-binding transcriptional regulator [Falsibacillus albus]RLQ96679.1 sugar-binding transcriptional regulator [Falsibacillus albus]
MYQIIDIQKRLLPDLLSTMQKRYQILRTIHFMAPVGRRSLAQTLSLTERVLRSEVDFLKDQNLIEVKTSGMSMTPDGLMILEKMEDIMREISGINEMEAQIKKRMQLQDVVIVPGNSDSTPWVKEELGRACAVSMKKRLIGKNIIAVTGGTTMAAVAETLTPDFTQKEVLFVPARGGIGEDVKNQANTICAKMAEQTGAKHRVLYVPDEVSKEVYQSFMREPAIKDVLNLISSANMVLHGIGDAITMAERRKTNQENMNKIIEAKAVGEAFGYYFNEEGEVVHKVKTIGLQLKDLAKTEHVIAVAGGASKAKAIRSYLRSAPHASVLITDEGAARELLKG